MSTTIEVRELPARLSEALAIVSSGREVLLTDGPPWHARFHFDRMLAAQSIVEGAEIVSADAIFGHYPVRLLW
jgi:PIN domain nuclease of toxin-antitoxin system